MVDMINVENAKMSIIINNMSLERWLNIQSQLHFYTLLKTTIKNMLNTIFTIKTEIIKYCHKSNKKWERHT